MTGVRRVHPEPDKPRYDAVVLAGGRSLRMSVADKTRLVIAGEPLLDRVLDSVVRAESVIVVGDERPTITEVTWVREEPAGGGPAAAIAAGLKHASAEIVVLIAGDMPLVTAELVEEIVAGVQGSGAVAIDGEDREQWLCSAWRRDVLAEVDLKAGGSLHAALRPLHPRRVAIGRTDHLMDCDTPADLIIAEASAREMLSR